ncbi:MAG: hypothetical protein IT464_13960 [Planctomycetes bacterium]|nr:hypothetical protein [Planctomycetota bacterium]
MRYAMMLSLLSVFFVTACQTSKSEMYTGTAGDAFEERRVVSNLKVLPVKLPKQIHGKYDQADLERFYRDWPMAGARLVADGVFEETAEEVRAMATLERPSTGYVFELEIEYLDLGDPDSRASSILHNKKQGWSHVLAKGRLINAETGDLVVELQFEQSSGGIAKPAFENDMANLGEELGRWLNDHR